MAFYVYILECSDLSYYTGFTYDINERLLKHEVGFYPDCYTFKKRPVKLVFTYSFFDAVQAKAFERKVKGWTRKKKKALIESDWDKIVEIVRKENEDRGIVFIKKPKRICPE